MESVLLNNPILLAMLIASAGFCLWDGRRGSGVILQCLSALFAGGCLLCSFFSGASVQELRIIVVFLLALQLGMRRGRA